MNSRQILKLHSSLHKVLVSIKSKNFSHLCATTVAWNQSHNETLLSFGRSYSLPGNFLVHIHPSQFRLLHSLSKADQTVGFSGGRNSVIFYDQRRQKGHSHYQNIKATKEANDKKRGATNAAITRQLTAAVKGNKV